jgi:hypothetical protein
MAIRLTGNQIRVLKELAAGGEHGQPVASAEFAQLIKAQYIARRPNTKHYVITDTGRQALAELTGFKWNAASRRLDRRGHRRCLRLHWFLAHGAPLTKTGKAAWVSPCRDVLSWICELQMIN